MGTMHVAYHFFFGLNLRVFFSAATRGPLISNSPTSCDSRLLLSQALWEVNSCF
jgi:hypothetical protein